MPHSLVTTSLEFALIAGRAVVLLIAFAMFAWGFIRWRKAAQRDTQRVFEQLDLVRSDLLIMKEVMANAAQRVDTAAQRVVQDARFATAPASSGRGYEIAARLARSGAQKEELMKNCGITAHEAELLVRLHGRAPAADAASQVSNPNTADTVRQTRRAPEQKVAARPTQQRSRLVAVG